MKQQERKTIDEEKIGLLRRGVREFLNFNLRARNLIFFFSTKDTTKASRDFTSLALQPDGNHIKYALRVSLAAYNRGVLRIKDLSLSNKPQVSLAAGAAKCTLEEMKWNGPRGGR